MAFPVSAFFALFCAVAAAAESKSVSPPSLSGVISGIEEGGRAFSIKGRDGGQRSVELSADVRVIRAIGLSEVRKGDRIYAVLGDVNGEMLMRRGIVNGDRPAGKGAGSKGDRVWGEVAEVDLAGRILKIRTNGGKVRTVGVAPRVRINAFVGAEDLKAGDSVVLISQGPPDPGKVRTVIVNSSCPGKF